MREGCHRYPFCDCQSEPESTLCVQTFELRKFFTESVFTFVGERLEKAVELLSKSPYGTPQGIAKERKIKIRVRPKKMLDKFTSLAISSREE